jgi:hypothetical protein
MKIGEGILIAICLLCSVPEMMAQIKNDNKKKQNDFYNSKR